jgi:hypothetical protein
MLESNPFNALLVCRPPHEHMPAPVPVSVQLGEDNLILMVTPGADPMQVAEAREIVTAVCRHLERSQILHRVSAPGADGRGCETIILPLPRRG